MKCRFPVRARFGPDADFGIDPVPAPEHALPCHSMASGSMHGFNLHRRAPSMLVIKLDALGTHSISWPDNDRQVISLGRRYLEKEASLPQEQQIKEPSLALVNQLTIQAEEAV